MVRHSSSDSSSSSSSDGARYREALDPVQGDGVAVQLADQQAAAINDGSGAVAMHVLSLQFLINDFFVLFRYETQHK